MPFCQACRVTYTTKEIRNMGLKMHTFPRRDWQQNFLVSWLSFCGMSLSTRDFKYKFVCSKHFEKEDYFAGKNRRLRLDAVPHLCPPPELVEDGDPMKNIATRPSQKKNIYDIGRREMLENVKKQLCRICGKRECHLKPIFTNCSDGATPFDSTAAKIQLYLPIKVENDESLPSNICTKCSDLLDQFHEINITCSTVDKIMRRTFGIDESDLLFQSNHDRTQEDSQESKRYKHHLREVVSQIFKECETQLEELIKPKIENEHENNDFNYKTRPKKKSHYVCRYCGEIFKSVEVRSFHTISCKYLPRDCEVCGKKIRRIDLRKHLYQCHSLPKNYMCDKCAKCFHTLPALNYHTRTKHGAPCDETYYCEICCSIFRKKEKYDDHLKKHEFGQRKVIFNIHSNGLDEAAVVYQCPVCENIFDDKVSLITHLNTAKDIQCVLCLSNFRTEKSFLIHLSIAKWKCQFCEKIFCFKHSVIAHERIHTGVKPFKCMVCDARFRTLSQKMRHQTVHYPPQFQCLYCGKRFRSITLHKRHIEEFFCNVCFKTFNCKTILQKHLRVSHTLTGGNQRIVSDMKDIQILRFA